MYLSPHEMKLMMMMMMLMLTMIVMIPGTSRGETNGYMVSDRVLTLGIDHDRATLPVGDSN